MPRLPTERLKAFVDGVVAIIITILVLDIDLPESDSSAILSELLRQLHPYIASFALVAAYWIQQTVILHYARSCDRVFIWLNILFLLPLSLLPLFTGLRVDHPTEAIAATLYGGQQILCGLLLLGIWRYATKNARLTAAPVDPSVVRSMSLRILAGPVLCLAGSLVSLASPEYASLIFITVPFLYVSHRKVDAHWHDAAAESARETP